MTQTDIKREAKLLLTQLAQNALQTWTPRTISHREHAKYQLIDFFSGSGGMSLGFSALASVTPFVKLLGGCDIDSDALETYSSNFGVPAIRQDVKLLAERDADYRDFVDRLNGYDPNQPTIVIGCAPCQGFSAHRKKTWQSQQADARNELVGAFASVAVRFAPTCIVMENVPELLSDRYITDFHAAKTVFERAGYIVKTVVLNAAGFGVPQQRFRAVIVAMKEDFGLPEPFLTQDRYVTVRQAIASLPPVAAGETCPMDDYHRSANHKAETLATIRAVPHDGGSRPRGVGPKCLDRVKGFSDVYGRLYWDKPAITITRYSRNPASGRYVHPEQDRGLTVREAALLQSYPSNFRFAGSFESVFRQIGEAVPPRFACAIAASVFVDMLPDSEIPRFAESVSVVPDNIQ
jgi:DNA (cytosine-5)-methyltransferase 1